MNGKQYFSMLARYHHWAFRRLYQRVDELADADYFADKRLFFRSVHGSLNHLLLVDRLWLDRLRGKPTGKVDLARELVDDRAALRDAVFRQCDALVAFVDEREERDLETYVSYASSTGERFTRPMAPLIAHIVNHATHHRGQVSATLTQLGVEAPVMDLPYFLAESPDVRS